MNRRTIAIISLVVLASAVVAWWANARRRPAMQWQGYAEADFVKVGPQQQGLLVAVRVARGDQVKKGTPLFEQDATGDLAARDQAKQQMDQAVRQLANLKAPGRTTEIAQAEANVADAMAVRDRARSDLARAQQLSGIGGVSLQTLDQMKADVASAEAKVAGMSAALNQMRQSTGRRDEIQAQEASVEAFRQAVAMAEWKLSQRHVAAEGDAVVADVLARPGETLAAGAPVVSLLPPGNIFVRFFVPESQLAQIHYGDSVALSVDGGPSNLAGTISFISPQAEFTPPVIYSAESRTKLVYMVEARPQPDEAALLHPGQPVTVALSVAGARR